MRTASPALPASHDSTCFQESRLIDLTSMAEATGEACQLRTSFHVQYPKQCTYSQSPVLCICMDIAAEPRPDDRVRSRACTAAELDTAGQEAHGKIATCLPPGRDTSKRAYPRRDRGHTSALDAPSKRRPRPSEHTVSIRRPSRENASDSVRASPSRLKLCTRLKVRMFHSDSLPQGVPAQTLQASGMHDVLWHAAPWATVILLVCMAMALHHVLSHACM